MSRSYLLLIALLLIIVLGVGAFGFSKMSSQPKNPPTYQSTNSSPIPNTPPAAQNPSPTPPSDVDPSKNTLLLNVISPQDNSTVTTPTITISGATVPNADVAVNDKDLKADASGKFTATLTLDEGENYILVVASNDTGAAEWQGTVTYTPSQ